MVGVRAAQRRAPDRTLATPPRPGAERGGSMVIAAGTALELYDIQQGVLHPRPSPYVGTYLLLRIDDRQIGRAMLRRLIPVIPSAANTPHPASDSWASVAFTFQGLQALGVPQASL